jgi:uncharacterized membrane protein (DUF441 family)
MTKTEELVNILTAYRFIAMLMALLVAIMGHYGIAIDTEVASMIQNFLVGFIGVNTAGKLFEALKGLNPNQEGNIN